MLALHSPLLAQSRHGILHCKCPLMNQSGHRAKRATRAATSDAELLTRLREIIYLPSSSGKRILDRYLNMLVPCILRRRVVDENVFVRRNCKPDTDLEPGP